MGASRAAIVGGFVLGTVLLFSVGLFMIGDRRLLFVESTEVFSEFGLVTGLQVGSVVRVAGLDAGEVLEITIPGRPSEPFRVRMRVREDVSQLIRTNSVATIQTDGLVGSQFVQIGGGTDDAELVPAGGTVPGRDPLALADLVQEGTNTFRSIATEILTVKDDAADALQALGEAARSTNTLVTQIRDDVEEFARLGVETSTTLNDTFSQMRAMTERVSAGEGTVGRLLTDDGLYESARRLADETQGTIASLRAVSDDVHATLEGFRADDAPAALMSDLRETVGFAKDAMADIATNMEALKRNWLFRGFFQERGFYDLDAVTAAEYRGGALERDGRRPLRVWLDAEVLFEATNVGDEILTEAGQRRLDSAMGGLLQFPRDSPLVVEGYAEGASPEAEFLRSQLRGEMVRDYLATRFRRVQGLTGVIPLGQGAVGSPRGNGTWDGIALTLFVNGESLREGQAVAQEP